VVRGGKDETSGYGMLNDYTSSERFILDRMREAKTPGLSVSIVSNGRMTYAKRFGFRDIASGLPVTNGTLFGIGEGRSFAKLAQNVLALTILGSWSYS
jgi:hypothetical protein